MCVDSSPPCTRHSSLQNAVEAGIAEHSVNGYGVCLQIGHGVVDDFHPPEGTCWGQALPTCPHCVGQGWLPTCYIVAHACGVRSSPPPLDAKQPLLQTLLKIFLSLL